MEENAEIFFIIYLERLTIRVNSMGWIQFKEDKEVVLSYSKRSGKLLINGDYLKEIFFPFHMIADEDQRVKFISDMFLKYLKWNLKINHKWKYYGSAPILD
jgi:hypothetical protein